MKTAALSLDLIRTDGGTQMRAALDQAVYFDYRDKWLSGVQFDPVDVFHDGSTYWLADGFHRFYGAREAKRSSIPCRVHNGTQRDAILFACGANAAHGLRRTNEDKRIAVCKLLNDEVWVTWSDNAVAEKCHVTQPFVREVRAQLITVISSPAAKTANEPRIGKDGKKRKPRRKPMKQPTQAQVSAAVDIAVPREPGDDELEPQHTEQHDHFKFAVPEGLREAFAEVGEFNRLRKLCADLKAGAKNICESKAGGWLRGHFQELEEHCDQIKRILRFSAPHTECAKCKRKPDKKCPACKGTGWVTEAMMSSSFSDAEKKWLESR